MTPLSHIYAPLDRIYDPLRHTLPRIRGAPPFTQVYMTPCATTPPLSHNPPLIHPLLIPFYPPPPLLFFLSREFVYRSVRSLHVAEFQKLLKAHVVSMSPINNVDVQVGVEGRGAINTPYQHTLSTHPVNTSSYQPTPSTHPINSPYQHTLPSTHPLNIPYNPLRSSPPLTSHPLLSLPSHAIIAVLVHPLINPPSHLLSPHHPFPPLFPLMQSSQFLSIHQLVDVAALESAKQVHTTLTNPTNPNQPHQPTPSPPPPLRLSS